MVRFPVNMRERLIPAWAGKTAGRAVRGPPRAAHPRVGGENLTCASADWAAAGSSPRGRGKRSRTSGRWSRGRLIPAWAGKTPPAGAADGGDTAHPRVGGENSVSQSPGLCASGSSPRGRGKLSEQIGELTGHGLIPAWAGKTRDCARRFPVVEAHPRVGGENPRGQAGAHGPIGSSPRGRGKQDRRERRVLRLRLIPAWAGKTRCGPGATGGCPAHPRVGGENFQAELEMIQERGSSPRGRGKRSGCVLPGSNCAAHPRVGGENLGGGRRPPDTRGSSPRGRGKRADRPLGARRSGLIPAWAGKTERKSLASRREPAHPRVGGENRWPATCWARLWGSSPRGRGKLGVAAERLDGGRLIPAWAGKTSVIMARFGRWQAHPRVGGENGGWARRARYDRGSSPRGRGKPDNRRLQVAGRRLIPAWAGKTS